MIQKNDAQKNESLASTKKIKKERITPVSSEQLENNRKLALLSVRAAVEKKAVNNILFEVGSLGAFTDFFLITSGSNEKQVQAIAEEIKKQGKTAGFGNPTIEGITEGRWVLIDFGGVIIHVFHEYIREFYDLEGLWADAPRVKIPDEYFNANAPKL